MAQERIFVTGGAGFIGSNLVRYVLEKTQSQVLNFDKLTYSGNQESLKDVVSDPRYRFVQGDICDPEVLRKAIQSFKPTSILHLAAESHVDRSIDGPLTFVETNVMGTAVLLNEAYGYWKALDAAAQKGFRFLHVSTDEVFGSLEETGFFEETTPYSPRSPYSASKASSDHLVRAWGHTYGFPILITNCSNNYGPFQYPEKLIPVVILNAINARKIPVYGKGLNVRDWLYVKDHVRAILRVLEAGKIGETYLIGGNNEKKNIELVHAICSVLNEIQPLAASKKYEDQIEYVTDRPGHDMRYAIDASKIKKELGWEPATPFEVGIRETVEWYLKNQSWLQSCSKDQYKQRLGLAR